MKKEFRVYAKGYESGQGHYIIANTKAEAIKKDKQQSPHRKNMKLDAKLWKTGKTIYDLKLTPIARKKMKLI